MAGFAAGWLVPAFQPPALADPSDLELEDYLDELLGDADLAAESADAPISSPHCQTPLPDPIPGPRKMTQQSPVNKQTELEKVATAVLNRTHNRRSHSLATVVTMPVAVAEPPSKVPRILALPSPVLALSVSPVAPTAFAADSWQKEMLSASCCFRTPMLLRGLASQINAESLFMGIFSESKCFEA